MHTPQLGQTYAQAIRNANLRDLERCKEYLNTCRQFISKHTTNEIKQAWTTEYETTIRNKLYSITSKTL